MAQHMSSMNREMRGFQKIMKAKVSEIKKRGGKTKKGKKIRDVEAYVAGGLRRTGQKKYGKKGFAARQKAGRKKAR